MLLIIGFLAAVAGLIRWSRGRALGLIVATRARSLPTLLGGQGTDRSGRHLPERGAGAERVRERNPLRPHLAGAVKGYTPVAPTQADTRIPAVNLAPPPAGAIADGVKLTRETATVRNSGARLGTLTDDDGFALENSSAGWSITVPRR